VFIILISTLIEKFFVWSQTLISLSAEVATLLMDVSQPLANSTPNGRSTYSPGDHMSGTKPSQGTQKDQLGKVEET